MNVQEFVDSEVAKGNTDIHIPDGLESINVLKFPAGISVTFPWTSFEYPAALIKQKNNKGVRVSLPHSWRSDLRVMAKQQGTTVNQLILDAIQEKYFPLHAAFRKVEASMFTGSTEGLEFVGIQTVMRRGEIDARDSREETRR